MPRRNQRVDKWDDDEAEAPIVIPKPRTRLETVDERRTRLAAEFGRTRQRNERRIDKRVAEAIESWDVCCIPGCDTSLRLPAKRNPGFSRCEDPSQVLPMCRYHEVIVMNRVAPHFRNADYQEMRERVARRRIEMSEATDERLEKLDENDGHDAQIYFVKLNGLIKVGWSSKLYSRLKSYGADVEILCHYPATRQDETSLHRQLRGSLARGREWYHDNAAIRLFVADALKRYGPPTVIPVWTVPRGQIVAGKRFAS